MQTTFDAASDVLYVRRAGVEIVDSVEAPEDDYLILNRDRSGEVVGAQLVAAGEMPPDFWRTHPDREALPHDILTALDAWIERGAVTWLCLDS